MTTSFNKYDLELVIKVLFWGEQGWPSGESTHLPLKWSGSILTRYRTLVQTSTQYLIVLLLCIEPPEFQTKAVGCSRNQLLGACNSHNKPMQRHFYKQSIFRYFSREIGQFQSIHEHASVRIKHCGLTWTWRHDVGMTTLVRAYDCNWLLRFLCGSEFEINSN